MFSKLFGKSPRNREIGSGQNNRFKDVKARYTDVLQRLPNDGPTLAAYERYVLAGFKFEPNSDALKVERQKAIDMLTP